MNSWKGRGMRSKCGESADELLHWSSWMVEPHAGHGLSLLQGSFLPAYILYTILEAHLDLPRVGKYWFVWKYSYALFFSFTSF